ncbi:urea ABC transporter ATP-binding protein UrtD [Caproicibacter fermentans]|uniref:Urea ABC transporter ATP-binding protein UrtD n=1 Tax=Caproicibacter fermentans TaxID=2576756 RepID=A0A7G8T670_9FIRM|nr:urea ABC transporter ATP-binding protein UrtD [Caproicibacter fermentans]QNK39111.1 urea ABC transporter ATP-binding protein UrtD [Caproicibacter fermentans]
MSDTILSLENISVTFDGFKAIQNVSTKIRQGELRFFIGPNGAGKTTLLDVICGKVKPVSGSVVFKGRKILKKKENEIVNIGIGRKFQVPSVFASLTVYENMQLSCAPRKTLLNSLLGRETPCEKEAIGKVLVKTGLADYKNEIAGTLSHGQKQWLEIAMLLVTGHSLLLMDEPVAGMGRAETDKTGELLREVSKTCSIIVVEHDMEFVRNFASSVTVLHEGKVLCEGPMEKVQNDPRVIDVYLGRGGEVDA